MWAAARRSLRPVGACAPVLLRGRAVGRVPVIRSDARVFGASAWEGGLAAVDGLLKAAPVMTAVRRKDLRDPPTLVVVSPSATVGRETAMAVGKMVGCEVKDLDDVFWGSESSTAERIKSMGSVSLVQESGSKLGQASTASMHGCIISCPSHYTMSHSQFDSFVENTQALVLWVDSDVCCDVTTASVPNMVCHDLVTSSEDLFAIHRRHLGRHYHIRVMTAPSDTHTDVVSNVMQELTRRLLPEHPLNPHNMFVASRQPPASPPDELAPVTSALAAGLRDLHHASSQGSTSSVGTALGHSLSQVMLAGTAGTGLFVPRPGAVPPIRLGELHRLAKEAYNERALCLLERWIPHEDLGGPAGIRRAIADAYADFVSPEKVVPLRPLPASAMDGLIQPNMYLLDLTDGPTASFKDLALQLTPRLIRLAITDSHDNGGVSLAPGSAETEAHPLPLVFCATSGDTGGAALHGFRGAGIPTLALFPQMGVSAVQRAQMVQLASEGGTTVALSVRGSDFDQCQSLVKKAFSDGELRDILKSHGYSLTAANSINFARLLSQMVYHTSAYLDAVRDKGVEPGSPINAIIPSGNFGNAMAAIYAREMGVPIGMVLCASNANNILADFLPDPIPDVTAKTDVGQYDISARQLMRTSSPAIDILRASNVERLVYLLAARRAVGKTGHDVAVAAAEATRLAFDGLDHSKKYSLDKELVEEMGMNGGLMLAGGWASEQEVHETVGTVTAAAGVPIDTHTAVAMAVLKRVASSNSESGPAKALGAHPTYITLTAHFSKFPTDFSNAVMGTAAPEDEGALEHARESFSVVWDKNSGGDCELCTTGHGRTCHSPSTCLRSFGDEARAIGERAAETDRQYWKLHHGVGLLAEMPLEVFAAAPKVECEYLAVRSNVEKLAALPKA